MNSRPVPVTLIGWTIVILSAASLALLPILWSNPIGRDLIGRTSLPIEIQQVIDLITLALSLTCGWGILKGRDWARLLYVAACLVDIILGLTTSQIDWPLLVTVPLLAMVAFFLFRGPANEFFGKSYRVNKPGF